MRILVALVAILWSGLALAANNTAIAPYPTHAALLSSVTSYVGPTISQSEFYAGTGGGATYVWNPNSYCVGGTSGTPVATDDVLCILPGHAAPYTSNTPGRYLLQVGSTIDVRAIGMVPGTQDNSPFVSTLMEALGTPNSIAKGGYHVVFSPVAGQSYTIYYFTQPFVLTRGIDLDCGNGIAGGASTILVFAPGVDGVIQEDYHYTPDGGISAGTVERCGISSQGFSAGVGSGGSNTLTGMFFFNGDPTGAAPASNWGIGDGILVVDDRASFNPIDTNPLSTPGTYVTNVSGTTLTLNNNLGAHFGSATASFTQSHNTSNNFIAGDTITIGNDTWKFVSTIGSTPGNVLLSTVNFNGSAVNLYNCINLNTTTSTCVAQSTTPNVYAEYPLGNVLGFWAATSGTAGDTLPTGYTAAGTSAGSFGGTTFTQGSNQNDIRAFQLPAAQAFTDQTSSGSSTVLITGGPRLLYPGDIIWSDAFPFGTTVSTTFATSVFTETSTNNFSNGDTILIGNNTYTAVSVLGSTPGTFLIGVDFPTSAANLVSCIQKTAGAGVTYIATTVAPNVNAVTNAFPATSTSINFVGIQKVGPLGTAAVPSVYTPSGTPAGSFQAATGTYQTATMAIPFMNGSLQNATQTDSPGTMWILPAGLKRDTEAASKGMMIRNWPFGLEMSCTNSSLLNCTSSRDEYGAYLLDMFGRWTAGDNTGSSIDLGDQMADNLFADVFEGGTVGSTYVELNAESGEGSSKFSILGNCINQNNSVIVGGYIGGSGQPNCAAIPGLVPTTVGGFLNISPEATSSVGAPVISGRNLIGQWTNESGAYNTTCISFGQPLAGLWYQFGLSNAQCSAASTFGWGWNNTLGSWDLNNNTSGLIMRMASINTTPSYSGYLTNFNGIEFPVGALFWNTENVSTSANNARVISAGSAIPTGTWHLQGDAQFNTLSVPGSSAAWVDTPSLTTTLSELVWTGAGGFTGDISGTNLSVTSVPNATPAFTGGAPGTISGLNTVAFPVGANIVFTGSGTMPTGLAKNTQYVIVTSSATAATVASSSAPTTALAFTGSGSGTIAATKGICVGGAITGTGVGGGPTIVSLPGGAAHGCVFGTTGTYVLSGTPTGGASFNPVFTGGTPGTISGLTAANFPR